MIDMGRRTAPPPPLCENKKMCLTLNNVTDSHLEPCQTRIYRTKYTVITFSIIVYN